MKGKTIETEQIEEETKIIRNENVLQKQTADITLRMLKWNIMNSKK